MAANREIGNEAHGCQFSAYDTCGIEVANLVGYLESRHGCDCAYRQGGAAAYQLPHCSLNRQVVSMVAKNREISVG
ncbi:hypothetical protein TNCV_4797241 [Trichonephila clavipes]|nr:hypothetical protein TNCV_4797241 [Trichonephila clavipes]